MTAKDKLIEKLKEYLELLKNSLIYGECPLDADYANSLIKEISALESEIKEKDEPKMSAEEILAGYMYQYFPTGHIYSGYMFYEKIAVVDAMEKYANQFKQ